MGTDWRAHVRARLPRLAVSAEREIEIVDELAAQLEASYDRARREGGDHTAAMARAGAEVPDWRALARKIEGIESRYTPPPVPGVAAGGIMTGLVQDIRHAARSLRRAPGFTAVAIVTLALGIAATTIVYSLVDAILLRPLPIQDPDRVVLMRETFRGEENSISWPNFLDIQARATSFEQLAVWRGYQPNLTGIGEPRRIMGRQVTSGLFSVLGVRPVLGRDFTAADDRFGADRTCLVSFGFWKRELGGEASAIGKTIQLDEVPTTVIGVLPAGFTVARQEDIFLPFSTYLTPDSFYFGRGNHNGLAGIGRLKPGVSVESANAEVDALAHQLEVEHPETNSGNGGIVRPLMDVLVSGAKPMLYVLLGAVASMLLIACVNLANLLLSRAAGRAQEMAVRQSLGAARWRLARQMLTESLMLAFAGGAAGVVLAYAGFNAVVAIMPASQPRIHTVSLDLRVLWVSAAVSVATGLLFGFMPALHAATGRAMLLMRNARVTGATQTSALTRRSLLFAEVALALVLVAGAGLMLRSVHNLLAVDTGVDADRVIAGTFSLPNRYTPDTRAIFVDQVVARLRGIPGVRNAAYVHSLPVAPSQWHTVFIVEGQPVPERKDLPESGWIPATAGYFDTMGIRLIKGRGLDDSDSDKAAPVIVVNERFEKRFFPNGDALGNMVKQGWPENTQPWRRIVGVVNDVRVDGLEGAPPLQMYLPNAQMSQGYGTFVARTDGNPQQIGRALEAAVHEIDPNLPVYDVRTIPQIMESSIGNQRMTMMLLMGFAVLSLIMAAIGVFGVTAYSVSLRTHEVGVRMALGAHPSSVLRLILRQEMLACVLGVVAGVIGALLLSSLLRSLLFNVAPRDAATLTLATIVLLVVTSIACYLPARRATRVDPVRALRSE
jgi:putative ABC transport system permease protein